MIWSSNTARAKHGQYQPSHSSSRWPWQSKQAGISYAHVASRLLTPSSESHTITVQTPTIWGTYQGWVSTMFRRDLASFIIPRSNIAWGCDLAEAFFCLNGRRWYKACKNAWMTCDKIHFKTTEFGITNMQCKIKCDQLKRKFSSLLDNTHFPCGPSGGGVQPKLFIIQESYMLGKEIAMRHRASSMTPTCNGSSVQTKFAPVSHLLCLGDDFQCFCITGKSQNKHSTEPLLIHHKFPWVPFFFWKRHCAWLDMWKQTLGACLIWSAYPYSNNQ